MNKIKEFISDVKDELTNLERGEKIFVLIMVIFSFLMFVLLLMAIRG